MSATRAGYDNIAGQVIGPEVFSVQKRQKVSFDIDEDLRKRIMRVTGLGLIEGHEISLRAIITGALESLTDDQLLEAAKDVIAKEKRIEVKQKKKA